MKPLLQNRTEPPYEPVGNGGKIWDVNFDTPVSFTVASYGNDIKITQESDGNKALLHKRTNSTSAFHTDVKSVATQSECVVYAYDIKILNLAETQFSVQLKDYDANYSTMLTLRKNGQLTLGNSLQTLAQNKNNKTKTAELLGIGRKTLHRKLEEYGVEKLSQEEK